jgi:hypothetical protein
LIIMIVFDYQIAEISGGGGSRGRGGLAEARWDLPTKWPREFGSNIAPPCFFRRCWK